MYFAFGSDAIEHWICGTYARTLVACATPLTLKSYFVTFSEKGNIMNFRSENSNLWVRWRLVVVVGWCWCWWFSVCFVHSQPFELYVQRPPWHLRISMYETIWATIIIYAVNFVILNLTQQIKWRSSDRQQSLCKYTRKHWDWNNLEKRTNQWTNNVNRRRRMTTIISVNTESCEPKHKHFQIVGRRWPFEYGCRPSRMHILISIISESERSCWFATNLAGKSLVNSDVPANLGLLISDIGKKCAHRRTSLEIVEENSHTK